MKAVTQLLLSCICILEQWWKGCKYCNETIWFPNHSSLTPSCPLSIATQMTPFSEPHASIPLHRQLPLPQMPLCLWKAPTLPTIQLKMPSLYPYSVMLYIAQLHGHVVYVCPYVAEAPGKKWALIYLSIPHACGYEVSDNGC